MASTVYADELPGRTVRCGGEEYRYFAGTSYLGISRNEAFGNLVREGMNRYGYNYASSRNGNIQLRIYEEAETYLAAFTGAPAALTVSSGLLAGQLVTQYLRNKGLFWYAPQTHPALWASGVSPDASITWQEWADALPEAISKHPEESFILFTNSLDPLLLQPYDFSWVGKLPPNKQIILVIDDSHGVGITGPAGAGIYQAVRQQYPTIALIVVASLGKALGLPGGVLAGSQELIESVRESPFFGGASPMPPAYLYAFLQGQSVYEAARQQLKENVYYFTEAVKATGLFRFKAGYPVFYTPHHHLYDFLKARNILISCFPYPTPQSEPLTRIVLNSLHTKADLNQLITIIWQFTP